MSDVAVVLSIDLTWHTKEGEGGEGDGRSRDFIGQHRHTNNVGYYSPWKFFDGGVRASENAAPFLNFKTTRPLIKFLSPGRRKIASRRPTILAV